MPVFQAIVLGVVQGVTEFLPISSSGHLIFFPTLFGWQDQGIVFDTVVHVGTLVAVVAYFRKKLATLLSQRRLLFFIIASAIPAGFTGVIWGDNIERLFRSPAVVGWSLIGWGVVLGLADRYEKRHAPVAVVGWKQMIAMACAQILAFIPGTSRSGITMTAGLFTGLSKITAAEFSFLMSIPVIAAAGAAGFRDLAAAAYGSVPVAPFLAGFFAAAVSGFLAITVLLRLLTKHGFFPFVVYRVAVGFMILVFLV